jgi:phosphatidylglycerophosphate synthase
MEQEQPINRRQLATRGRAWAQQFARGLARIGIKPNQISVAGIVVAIAGAFAFCAAHDKTGGKAAGFLVLGAIGIQLRLLCNMLDGLLAIEGGLKSKTGDLYNEVPDRIADIALLIGAGYSFQDYAWGVTFGWTAAMLAVLTAYVRLLGGSLGLEQDFAGPMAKQHRMFTLTVGALAAAVEVVVRGTTSALAVALALIIVLSGVTLLRRLVRIARALEAR